MRYLGLMSALCLLIASAAPGRAQNFDPEEVVRKVGNTVSRSTDAGPRTDEGEFLVDVEAVYVPALDAQEQTAAAFDGENFLIVWQDSRTAANVDIFGARVSPEGLVLDQVGFAISSAPGHQRYPAVTFNGTNFLVVWTDDRNGQFFDIYGARVTPDGVVLDTAGFPISADSIWQESPAVASDGVNSLVVWKDHRSGQGYDLYCARVTPGGAVLDTAGVLIITAPNQQEDPALAFDGANYLVVWQDLRTGTYPDIYCIRVTPNAVVLDTQEIAVCTNGRIQYGPSLAFDGTNFLVVWEDYRNGPNCDIFGARVTPAGSVLDTAGIPISLATNKQRRPSVAFTGTSFVVAWDDMRYGENEDLFATFVSPDGVVLDTAGIQVARAMSSQAFVALARVGDTALAVWQDHRVGPPDIYVARVTNDGVVLDPDGFIVSQAANKQESPAAAFDGTNHLVVWQDNRSNVDFDIFAARVSVGGVVLDSHAIPVSRAPYNQIHPSVAFDGTNYLVAWEDYRDTTAPDIYAARVTPGGVVLDSAGFVINQAAQVQEYPAVAFGRADYLVVWHYHSSHYDICGTRVTPGGVVLDTAGIVISDWDHEQRYPTVAFGGYDFLVAWEDGRNGRPYHAYGTLVSQDGLVRSPNSIRMSRMASEQRFPSASFSGTQYLLAWVEGSFVRGTRVTLWAGVLDTAGIEIGTRAYQAESPSTAFNGTDFCVTWRDQRNGPESDIYGAWVNRDGVAHNLGPFVTQDGVQACPVLCRSDGDHIFLAYQGWASDFNGKSYNADRAWCRAGLFAGAAEGPNTRLVEDGPGPTFVRGVLTLRESQVDLLDISGRRVLSLHPGPNDVRHLAPGIYFVREPSAASGKPSAVSKVVVTR